MSVVSELYKVTVVGDGSTPSIAFNRKVFASSDIKGVKYDTTTLAETALVNGSDFTVSGAGNESTGVTITPSSSIPTGTNWVIYSDQGSTQITDLQTQGPFPANTIEYMSDKLAIAAQEVEGKADRSLKLPISDSASVEIPNATDRASKVLGFDANGAIQAVTASALTPEYKSVTDFGAVGDGVTDDTAALQGALDSNALVIMPAGKYRTTSNLVIDPIRNRNCGFIGSVSPSIYPATQQTGGPAWDGTKECQIFYDGSTGSTTAVIAISAEAVGTEPSSTFENSIWGVRFENITFNGNDKAKYGFYAARLQQPYVTNCVARQCEGDGWYINGTYSGMFQNIIARSNGGRGISIGAAGQDLSWTTNNKVNGVSFSNLWAYNNGLDTTYDETSAPRDGAGIFFRPHRGCTIDRCTAELNDGVGILFAPTSSGNSVLNFYTELNDPTTNNGVVFEGISGGVSYGNLMANGFIASEDLLIQGTEPSTGRPEGSPEFRNISGGSGITATYTNYRLVNVDQGMAGSITGSSPRSEAGAVNNHPVVADYATQAYATFDATAGSISTTESFNCSIAYAGTGIYDVTIADDMSNANYTVAIAPAASNRIVAITTKAVGSFRILHTNASAVATDSSAVLSFAVVGKRTI
jgi:hypothetical protein